MQFTARTWTGIVTSELIGVGAIALLFYYLPLSGATELSDPWATERVIAYLLMFLGPLFLFLPWCLVYKFGPLWFLGSGSWALLGYVLIFVGAPQRDSATLMTYAAFLALLFVAIGSALAVPLGIVSSRFLQQTTGTANMVRAMREGALASLLIVSLLSMSPLGVLNWLNALLAVTTVALTEFFFLARE